MARVEDYRHDNTVEDNNHDNAIEEDDYGSAIVDNNHDNDKEDIVRMKKILKKILSSSPHIYPSQCWVIMIGILSSLLCLIILTISMVMVVTDNTWHMVMRKTDLWLQENHWDIKASKIRAVRKK